MLYWQIVQSCAKSISNGNHNSTYSKTHSLGHKESCWNSFLAHRKRSQYLKQTFLNPQSYIGPGRLHMLWFQPHHRRTSLFQIREHSNTLGIQEQKLFQKKAKN